MLTADGRLHGTDNEMKYYKATDNDYSEKYVGLTPEDITEIVK
jgi:hypothetical protein